MINLLTRGRSQIKTDFSNMLNHIGKIQTLMNTHHKNVTRECCVKSCKIFSPRTQVKKKISEN